MTAHFIPEFLFRIAGEIDIAAEPSFDPPQGRQQICGGHIANHQEIDVTFGGFFTTRNRPVNGSPPNVLPKFCEVRL